MLTLCRRLPITRRIHQLRRFGTKDIEYERKTPLEHVMLRPGMYVGQTSISPLETWILDPKSSSMVKKVVNISPALLKIFDEIIVNAADNRQRDSKMSKIEINVSCKDQQLEVSILNDGKGIPVEMHKKEKLYIPELIFGHLLTGSNFDDSVSRLTGGSHGYGAKLTNMFSKVFSLETYDAQKKLLFQQEWQSNMTSVGQAQVTKTVLPGSYTKITFQPDLLKLGFDTQTSPQALQDAVAIFRRRALDIAGSIGAVKVYYNSELIPVTSFKEYVGLFRTARAGGGVTAAAAEDGEPDAAAAAGATDTLTHAVINKRWEVAVKRSPTNTFESMSFVNNVWTTRGGTHVNLVTAQLIKAVEETLKKKGHTVYPAMIRSKLMVFVNCQVENPSFEGQSKDQLNTKPQAYGSECVLPAAFLRAFLKDSGVIESLLIDIQIMEKRKLIASTKTSGSSKRQVMDVPKLQDAHLAGSSRSSECTLILTEGDSAKALAVAGFEVVGRELYGVMPLRGKVLNVRVATKAQLSKNEELLNLCKAVGLDFTQKYTEGLASAGLRYGKIMIMCDQDTDGSHIKGLLLNLFHHFWPSLLQQEGFLQQFITPIVKASFSGALKKAAAAAGVSTAPTTGNALKNISFYSIPEYDEWRSQLSAEDMSKWHVKYYKGLGTNTAAEGRLYFAQLEKHRKLFVAASSGAHDDRIDLAFSKDRAEDRKKWLSEKFDPAAYINPHQPSVTIEEFVDKELIHFSAADNVRSIPSVVDGLKPSQRKVLYGCFKKNLKEEAKVVQIAGYIAEHTAYHHGEASLHATIINMAQDFVGSNNAPLLMPSGQFGTRAQGGKDFASPRYIFTRLSPLARALYPAEDDDLLLYEEEDGQTVEPRFFVPVVPALLLNGSNGIGTGWSTSIPSYSIRDVISVVRNKLLGKKTSSSRGLVPWTRGFKGTTTKVKKQAQKFTSSGVATRLNATTVEISELPVGRWTDDFKEMLCGMVERSEIRSFTEHHTTDSVRFEVKVVKSVLDELEAAAGGLLSAFKLESPINGNNMHAFNPQGVITKYASPEEIVEAHFDVRLQTYVQRKAQLERSLVADEIVARNKSQFINDIVNKRINLLHSESDGSKLRSVPESELVDLLRHRNYQTSFDIQAARADPSAAAAEKRGTKHGFDYLLDLPIHSLTEERAVALNKVAAEALQSLEASRALSEKDLWLSDLKKLEKKYTEMYGN